MRIKVSLALLLLISAAAVFGAQQGNGSPANSEAAQARDEIHGIERLLPQLPDRGPALFELAHDYALWGDWNKALALLKQCVALNEGFDPEGDPTLQRLKHGRESPLWLSKSDRQFPPVLRARLAFIDEANFYFMANTHLDNWKDEKIVDPTKLEAVRIAVIHLD